MGLINYLRIKFAKKVEIHTGKQYVWFIEANKEEMNDFANQVARARRRDQSDLIVSNNIKIKPAAEIKTTLDYSKFNSKTQLLKAIKKAIWTDWESIGEIKIDGDGLISVTRYKW